MFRKGLVLTLFFTAIFGGIYPLFVFCIGQLFFPFHAEGSLLFSPKTQTLVGSELIAQGFESPRYFHPRPSETKIHAYNGMHSGSSELGPTQKLLIETNLKRAQHYRKINSLSPDTYVPVDAITASASGLDPHISLSNALLQAPRVAQERNCSEEKVHTFIEQCTRRASFGLFGEARVNVLMLNLALDRAVIEKVE